SVRRDQGHRPAFGLQDPLLRTSWASSPLQEDAAATAGPSCPRPPRSSSLRLRRIGCPCLAHVRRTLASTACVSAPASVRLPADSFLAITAGRISRAAKLFVASSPS